MGFKPPTYLRLGEDKQMRLEMAVRDVLALVLGLVGLTLLSMEKALGFF